ncbi:MAG TPA: permease [Pseudolabrys sp.]|nr:permease [Pseudolabrys sp.]
MSRPDTLLWLGRHELRLGWRDWLSMMTAGRRKRARTVAIALIVFAAFMHLLAWSMVARYAEASVMPDKATLVMVSGTILLSWSLLLSQAMESVTRAFYARSDLDLILTSPVSHRKVFSVRIARIAGSVALIAVLLASPFINVLVWLGGVRWLAAYGVVAAMGAMAAALAVALTIALFRTIGAKRTRLVAQILAAVIGAAFVIGLQVVAILNYGNLSRFAALQSDWLMAHAPNIGSMLYWPARAVLGDPAALAAVAAASLTLLVASIAIFAGNFGDHVVAAAGVSSGVVRQRRWQLGFRRRPAARVLRHKEWTLLRRDPWLMSQSLMQILYLLPPALLLWKSFQGGTSAIIVLVPVVVMAAGQLGGGLAWLSISGEDAPDLVATAPITARRILWAKIEAVMGVIAMVFAPFLAALALASAWAASVASVGVLIGAASATLVQLCFRTQARRSQFRRRQTSSRIATFAEAFSSIAWAGAAALAAAGTWFALAPAIIAVAILAGVKWISPPNHA